MKQENEKQFTKEACASFFNECLSISRAENGIVRSCLPKEAYPSIPDIPYSNISYFQYLSYYIAVKKLECLGYIEICRGLLYRYDSLLCLLEKYDIAFFELSMFNFLKSTFDKDRIINEMKFCLRCANDFKEQYYCLAKKEIHEFESLKADLKNKFGDSFFNEFKTRTEKELEEWRENFLFNFQ